MLREDNTNLTSKIYLFEHVQFYDLLCIEYFRHLRLSFNVSFELLYACLDEYYEEVNGQTFRQSTPIQ